MSKWRVSNIVCVDCSGDISLIVTSFLVKGDTELCGAEDNESYTQTHFDVEVTWGRQMLWTNYLAARSQE